MATDCKGQGQRPVRSSTSKNPLIRKLANFTPLTASDECVIDGLLTSEEIFSSDADIIMQGMAPRSVFLMLEGLATRYRDLPDGGRQIMTFLMPGDLCDPHVFMLKAMDHSIGAITDVRVAPISRDALMDVFSKHPRISAGLWWSSMQEQAMLRERIVSLGRRDARGRIAYLLCELLWRYEAVGLTNGGMFRLPLTQAELGDALGLTSVHVNKVLKQLRAEDLVTIEHRQLTILHVSGLEKIVGFNKSYLNLAGASSELALYFDDLEAKQQERDQ